MTQTTAARYALPGLILGAVLIGLAPVFLTLVLHFGFGQRHAPRFWLGLGLSLAGATVLMADSLRVSRDTALGDLCAIVTAMFYAAYQLLVQPIAATVFAWLILHEGFGPQQVLGGVIVMAGILLCRFAMPAHNPQAEAERSGAWTGRMR